MILSTNAPFKHHRNGNAYRRDRGARPRYLYIGSDVQNGFIELHRAGDRCTSTAHVRDVFRTPDLIEHFCSTDAMRIGVEFQKWRDAANAGPQPEKTEGESHAG